MSCSPDCGCDAASCCEGNDALVPEAKDNPPGQATLRYRVGTYASFFETMLARLVTPPEPAFACDPDAKAEPDPFGVDAEGRPRWPLRELTTRDADDPTLALLDAWAVVGDVLTFYQERIVNEGYLRTATELRSVEELARLVGHRPRPGVAAGVDLAFTLDPGQSTEVPAGTRAQSLPAPGKLPQAYETSEPLRATADWNAMRPLQAKFQRPRVIEAETKRLEVVLDVFDDDRELVVDDFVLMSNDPSLEDLYRIEVASETPIDDGRRVRLTLRAHVGGLPSEWDARHPDFHVLRVPTEGAGVKDGAIRVEYDQSLVSDGRLFPPDAFSLREVFDRALVSAGSRWRLELYLEGLSTNVRVGDVMLVLGRGASPTTDDLFRAETIEPLAATQRTRMVLRPYVATAPMFDETKAGGIVADAALRKLLAAFDRRRTKTPEPKVSATDRDLLELVGGDRVLREGLRRALEELDAGRDAPTAVLVFRASSPLFGFNALDGTLSTSGVLTLWPAAEARDERDDRLLLDVVDERVRPGSFVVVDPGVLARPPDDGEVVLPALVVRTVRQASIHPRTAYGISKSTLELQLDAPWIHWQPITDGGEFPGPPRADLAPLRAVMTHIESEPLRMARTPLGALAGGVLDLDGLVFDLEPGRALIVEGEAAAAPGSRRAERAIIASVEHDLVEVSTRIVLTRALRHAYLRPTTVVHGNVAAATQGESRSEILGSGDASRPSQEFTLRHRPLTHVPAATIDGVATTLTVRVGGLAWPEAELRALLGPRDRNVLTRTDDQGRTVVVGGDGRHGARFPTGIENLTAEYRSGQGADGNVDPGKITSLATRPFGVQKVTNPIAASGGAGPDDIEATRLRAPLAVASLDRLLSVKDHEDFALRFAGIAKARAQLVGSKGVHARWRVRTVVAGIEPQPLEPDAELIGRLRQAMRRFGDPALELEVVPARLELVSITAKLAVAPGWAFREVLPRVRAALTRELGYAAQGIGQAVVPSRVAAIIQAVPGVDYVDLDAIARDRIGDAALETDLDPLDVADKDDPATGTVDDERVTRPEPDAVLYVDAVRPENLVITEQKP